MLDAFLPMPRRPVGSILYRRGGDLVHRFSKIAAILERGMQMHEIETVIDAARDYGAESVRYLGDGTVRVSFRQVDEKREIGFIEVEVDSNVRLLDYRKCGCAAGEVWSARVLTWVRRAGHAVASNGLRRPSARPSEPRSSTGGRASILLN